MDQNLFKELADAWAKIYPQKIIRCMTKTGMPAHAYIYVHNPEEHYCVDDDKPLVEVLTEWCKWFTKTALEFSKEYGAVLLTYSGNDGYEHTDNASEFDYTKYPTRYTHLLTEQPFVEIVHEWDVKRNQNKTEVKIKQYTFQRLTLVWAWNENPEEAIECLYLSNHIDYHRVLTNEDTVRDFTNTSGTKPESISLKKIQLTPKELNDLYWDHRRNFRYKSKNEIYFFATKYMQPDDEYSIDGGVTWLECKKEVST